MDSWQRPSLPGRRAVIRTLALVVGSGMSTVRRALGQVSSATPSSLAPSRVLPPKVGPRVNIGEGALDGPTWLLASRPLQIAWREPGGDWIDANDAPNGPDAHATFRPASVDPPPIDVTSIVRRLLVENTGFLVHMPSGGGIRQ